MAPTIKFAWTSKTTVGILDYDRNLLLINLCLMISSTYIHEMLHYWHEGWSEDRVLRAENSAIRKMKVADIKKLATQVMRRAKR